MAEINAEIGLTQLLRGSGSDTLEMVREKEKMGENSERV